LFFGDVIFSCDPVHIDPVKEETVNNLHIESLATSKQTDHFKEIKYVFGIFLIDAI